MAVRPASLYGSECSSIMRTQVQRLKAAKINRDEDDPVDIWLHEKEVITDKVNTTLIENKIRYTRLRWFAHIKRRNMNSPVQRCERINLQECRRGRCRPKKS